MKELNKEHHCISPINQIELLGYNGPAKDLVLIEEFIRGSEIIPLDETVVAECILVRRSKKIKLPDAILAATAIVLGLTIITRNETDFKGLAGVKVINLHKL